jgi:hypothetical protein
MDGIAPYDSPGKGATDVASDLRKATQPLSRARVPAALHAVLWLSQGNTPRMNSSSSG